MMPTLPPPWLSETLLCGVSWAAALGALIPRRVELPPMDLHPVYGPSLPEAGWVPAPSYLLRRRRILALMADQQPGRYLEIGCGAGALLYDLQARGFECQALETSPDALALARRLHGRQIGARCSGGGKQARSHQSGISRSLEARLYPLQSSWLGVLAMRCAFALQRLSLGSDLGTGYLVMARLP